MKQRILLKGNDGIDLLNRITTLDFGRLTVGQWTPGLILNPQGKIICFFETKLLEPDAAEILFQDSFLEIVDQFTFSERYQIQKMEPVEPHSFSEAERIQKKISHLGNEFLNNGETNPLEVNLKNAIHDQKGCYPGQEVIEKIIAIGSPAKQLRLVKLVSGHTPAVPLELDHGKLTSFVAPFGLAIVRKTHLSPGSTLAADGLKFEVIE